MKKSINMTIGEAAKRSGVATSTLRFYEERNLIHSVRTGGNQRVYDRSVLRKISVIKVAQALGLNLKEIGRALSTLPENRAPDTNDWEKLSSDWCVELDTRIARLQRLRQHLSECIGCGCLSLKVCALKNLDDHLAESGSGPRLIVDDDESLLQ